MQDLTRKEIIIDGETALTLMPVDGMMEVEIDDLGSLSWVYITPEQAQQLIQFIQEWLDHGNAD